MHIVFIRHTESEKNVNNQFSSYKDKEPLTEIGMSQSENLGNDLLEFKERKT
ncbi:MAG: histidine phosphatase family protein [Bacteroidota bacterium]|nr:MAG: histidine phosphatase family protein [Bacteroidota bacterium]